MNINYLILQTSRYVPRVLRLGHGQFARVPSVPHSHRDGISLAPNIQDVRSGSRIIWSVRQYRLSDGGSLCLGDLEC